MEDRQLAESLSRYDKLLKSKVRHFLAKNPAKGILTYQEDLLQAAYLGAISAIKTFDESYGIPEQAYVAKRAEYAILQEFDRLNPVKSKEIVDYGKLMASMELIDSLYGRPTTMTELAQWECITEKKLVELLSKANRQFVSMENDVISLDDYSNSQMSEKVLAHMEISRYLLDGILKLRKRDKLIVKLLYIDDMSLLEAGKVLGIRKQSVAAARNRILGKLKRYLAGVGIGV